MRNIFYSITTDEYAGVTESVVENITWLENVLDKSHKDLDVQSFIL